MTDRYLDFYLDHGCTVVPCRPGTKQIVKGCGEWTAADSRGNRDRLIGNAAMRNGTGGLLVVDIDAKHGGTVEQFGDRFDADTDTLIVQTVSKGEHGLGVQLVYTIPDGFRIKPGVLVSGDDGPMVEVAPWAMLPGSRARGSNVFEPDPPMRQYIVVNDREPIPAPEQLLAVVEKLVPSDTAVVENAADGDVRTKLVHHLQQIESAGPGERNARFVAHVLPVIRLAALAGVDHRMLLTEAYERSGGTDLRWLDDAIKSSERFADSEPVSAARLGDLATDRLDRIESWARLAPWPGRSGPSDRRVFLAIVRLCREQQRTSTSWGTRRISVEAGLSRPAVKDSLERLEHDGLLETAEQGAYVDRRPVLRHGGGTPHILTKGSIPLTSGKNMCVSPLHVVWSSPKRDDVVGLNGRHGQLFDLVCAGLDTARALADYTGVRQDSIRRTLARVVEVGLLVQSGLQYAPGDDAAEMANRLAVELGGQKAIEDRRTVFGAENAAFETIRRLGRESLDSLDHEILDPMTWEPITASASVDNTDAVSDIERRTVDEQLMMEQVNRKR